MGFSFLHTKEVYYRKVNFDTLKTFLLTTLQEVDDQFLDFSSTHKKLQNSSSHVGLQTQSVFSNLNSKYEP